MKNIKNLWILKICLLVFLFLWGPLLSMVLAQDPEAIALASQKSAAKAALIKKKKLSNRVCSLKIDKWNLTIVAGPDANKQNSKVPAVKQSRRVPCNKNSSKFCSEWPYRFFWDGPDGGLASVSLSLPSNLKVIKVTPRARSDELFC